MPKPRNTGYIDEQLWLVAQAAAKGQVTQEFCIPGCLQAYYKGMCKPGQMPLAAEIYRRAQAVYDYKVGKAVYRENRRTWKP